MADIFDSIKLDTQSSQGDIFDQVANIPENERPTVKENIGSHPTYGVPQSNVNPLTALLKGGYKGGQNVQEENQALALKFLGANPDEMKNAMDFVNQRMSSTPLNEQMQKIPEAMPGTSAGVAQGLGQNVVQSLPAVGLSTALGPATGFGAANALEAISKNENPVMPFVKGAAMGKALEFAGGAGSSLVKGAGKATGANLSPLFIKRAGSALGGGVAGGAVSGGSPEGVIQGAGLGLAFPQEPLGSPKVVSPVEHQDLIDKGSKIYRNVLNPSKGVIDKVEIKSGGDINDSMKLASKMGLIIGSKEGKLDNIGAINQVQGSVKPLYQAQDKILSSNPKAQFNIQDLADMAKKNIDNEIHPAYIKSATEAQQAKAKIQNEADAEILRNGNSPLVNGQQLNTIKQGLWGKSYNPLEPNANDGARQLGFAAKDAIEKAYPDAIIKETNAQIGKYLQLQKILESTHGQVVQGGKLGGYVAQGIGALAGHASHIPFAEIVGANIGGKVKSILNDPARITGDWAKKINNVRVNNSEPMEVRRPGEVNPIVNELNPLANPQQGEPTNIPTSVKALGLAGAVGLGAMLNPASSQASDVKEPERLQLPSAQYTMKEEGFKGMPYIDTRGVKTVGYGFNMDGMASKYIPQAVKQGKRALTQKEATDIFNKIYPQAVSNAQKFSGERWASLSDNQKKALADMAYQLGGKLNGFKNLRQAIQGGHYNTAAREILNSNYANQARNRATRNAELIRR